jgi:hypothetical protein
MPTSLTDYGKYFAEMIETNMTSLIQSSPVRERNSNAPSHSVKTISAST